MCLPTRFCLGIFAAAALAISPAIAQCDDHNSCTSDALVDGVCVHTPVLEGTYCPELYGPCTRSPFCHAGQCNPGPIDDHNSCTTDTFVDGVCVLTPVPDGTFCVEGYKFCTQFPRCEAGYCDSGPITDCDDGNPCTDDFCGLLCRHIQLPNGTPCDDGISCTINEHCSYGACVAGGTTACPTDNPCTFGVCGHNGCEIYNRDSHVACDDGDPCTVNDHCDGSGGCVTEGPATCNDGNNCTDDSCASPTGCVYASNGICGNDPEALGYWKRLCEQPHASGEFVSQVDVACVRESCTFAAVGSVSEICDVLTADPASDKCEQAEAQLMALLLNVCRGRSPADLAIRSKCGDNATVGESRAEADELLCSPLRDDATCTQATCIAQEINSGHAP